MAETWGQRSGEVQQSGGGRGRSPSCEHTTLQLYRRLLHGQLCITQHSNFLFAACYSGLEHIGIGTIDVYTQWKPRHCVHNGISVVYVCVNFVS